MTESPMFLPAGAPAAPPAATEAHPEAPFGYKPDGSPYKRDPAAYKRSWENRPAAGKAKAAPAAPRKTAGFRAGAKPTNEERFKAIGETLLVIPASLGAAANMRQDRALAADAFVVSEAIPTISEALADLCDDYEQVAEVVDKLVAAGPWAALFGALVPLGLQLAANHNPSLAAAGSQFGIRTVDEILAEHVPPAGEQ